MQVETSHDDARERAAFMLKVEAAADPVLVICDAETCGRREFANPRDLRVAGWCVTRDFAFCPDHNTPE